ncbi:hypothetical protein HZ994_08275 [Akkermansiaceae bacterium]|nr:hypothetical protein HZ994_08275 [Akkermansiaceae bacterium]
MPHVFKAMKATLSLFLAGAIALCAADAPKAPAPGHAELIRQLSSESFKEREKATRALWEAGTGALAELREASRSEDPEVALRAAGVLEKIELRITPETPDNVLGLIRKYRVSSTNLKVGALNELKLRKAYFQVLKLFSMEPPEIRIQMAPAIRGVAITGARQAIARGADEEALELLRMSANEPNDLMALACAYRNMGRLGDGAKLPPAPDGVPPVIWKITIHRAKGEIREAADLAARSGQKMLHAGMNVLLGDPTLWLAGNGFGDSNMQALDAYVGIATRRWNGEKPEESDFEQLIRLLGSPEDSDREQAASSLAALGRLAEVEEAQAKDQPELGFAHYLSQERTGDALKVMGIDPQKPDYAAWVAERFAKLSGGGDRDGGLGSPETELHLLAAFMEQRGMAKEFNAAFSKPLEEIAEADEIQFMEFLRPLFVSSFGAPEFAFAQGAAWAGAQGQRWRKLESVAFGEEGGVMEWLSWIRKIEPDIPNADVMRAMMAITGLGADPKHLRASWMAKFWKAVEKSPDDEKSRLALRILSLSLSMNDVENALRARDLISPEDRNSVSWTTAQQSQYLSAAGRWKDAADILSKSRETVSSSPETHAFMAATLRKAGLSKEAAEADAWVEKLTLGYAPSCNRIGEHYTYGGDSVRAAKWYLRAAVQADISGGEFVAVLGNHAQAMLGKGEFDIAASCFEALAQVYVSERYSGMGITSYSKMRLSADLAKALDVLPQDRPRAIAMLDDLSRIFAADGTLADDFFPLVKEAGLNKELDRWFGQSWERVSASLGKYPDCDNSQNTAAWLASRAGRRLPEAEKLLKKAVARNPEQAAYLDTMAELRFAMGDRKGAVEWSERALLHYPLTESPYDTMIRKQHERFLNDALPQ